MGLGYVVERSDRLLRSCGDLLPRLEEDLDQILFAVYLDRLSYLAEAIDKRSAMSDVLIGNDSSDTTLFDRLGVGQDDLGFFSLQDNVGHQPRNRDHHLYCAELPVEIGVASASLSDCPSEHRV